MGRVKRGLTIRFGSANDFPAEQIMPVSTALRNVQQAHRGQKQVIVHYKGAMVDLDEEILAGVVVEQVGGDASALGHPVQPQPEASPVDMVVADDGIDGRVKLDTSHLRA